MATRELMKVEKIATVDLDAVQNTDKAPYQRPEVFAVGSANDLVQDTLNYGRIRDVRWYVWTNW